MAGCSDGQDEFQIGLSDYLDIERGPLQVGLLPNHSRQTGRRLEKPKSRAQATRKPFRLHYASSSTSTLNTSDGGRDGRLLQVQERQAASTPPSWWCGLFRLTLNWHNLGH